MTVRVARIAAASGAPVAFATIVASSVLAGCALNPYVADTRPPAAPLVAPAPAPPPPPGSLAYALAHAENTYSAYRSKLSEEWERQRSLSNGLMTLGFFATGAAIGRAHRDAVIGAALGGALVYELGTWNTNDGRLGIYLEGMKAMVCLQAAAAPLRFSSEGWNRIAAAESDVVAALEDAGRALANTTRWLHVAGASQTPNSETARTARAEIAEAAAQFNQASQLLQQSSALRQKAEGAGGVLESRIQDVMGTVDAALRDSGASLKALPQHIAGLLNYATIFAPGLKLDTVFNDRIATINPKPPSGPSATNQAQRAGSPAPRMAPLPLEPRDDLASALGELRRTRVMLAARTATLAGAVDRPIGQVQGNMSGCGVDAAKMANTLQLDRTQIRLAAGKPRTSQVGVRGGTFPVTASLLDLPAKGINVSMAGRETLLVVADATTVGGQSYQVKVEDAANASAMLTITVETDGAPAIEGAPEGRECTGPRVADRPLLCLIQNIQHLNPTGELDRQTCTKVIDAYAADGVIDDATRRTVLAQRGLPEGASDAQIGAALSAAEQSACKLSSTAEAGRASRRPALAAKPAASAVRPPAPRPLAGARNDVERSLSEGELLVIARRIDMRTPPREFTDDFRRALAEFQKRNGLPDTKGELTPEFVDRSLR